MVAPKAASRSAMAHVVRTFFAGSAADAATALFELPDRKWTRDELDQLNQLIRRAQKEGR